MFALLIAFAITACADDSNAGGSTDLGETPTLSGQVYFENVNKTNRKVSYAEYKGNLTVSGYEDYDPKDKSEDKSWTYLAEKGSIKNGVLSYTLGTPKNLGYSYGIKDFFNVSYYYDNNNITVSPSTAKGYGMAFFDCGSYRLQKSNFTISGSTGTDYNLTFEYVRYLYVDRDVTISGKGKTFNLKNKNDTERTKIFKSSDINLELEAGWNTIYFKEQGVVKGKTYTLTVSCSTGNPNLKWVLDDSYSLDVYFGEEGWYSGNNGNDPYDPDWTNNEGREHFSFEGPWEGIVKPWGDNAPTIDGNSISVTASDDLTGFYINFADIGYEYNYYDVLKFTYQVEVTTPSAVIIAKKNNLLEELPYPADWGIGCGREYFLGDATKSVYNGPLVKGTWNGTTGTFEVKMSLMEGAYAIGFQHNYWAQIDGETVAENSEYKIKLLKIENDVLP